MKLLAAFTALVFSFPNLPAVQEPSPSPAQPPQRDPQALATLGQAVASSGGLTALSAVQDYTQSGTITYSWAGKAVPGTVTLYGKGLGQFHMDVNVSGGIQSLIVSGDVGVFLSQDGQKTSLPFYNLVTAGSRTFPFARIVAAMNDPSTNVTTLGLVTSNGAKVYQVHVGPPFDQALIAPETPPGLGSFDLYFDPASYQLLQLDETVRDTDDFNQTYLHEIIFSNYKPTNGLSLPFTISEKINGQQTWSIELSSVVFNTGLSDSLFAL